MESSDVFYYTYNGKWLPTCRFLPAIEGIFENWVKNLSGYIPVDGHFPYQMKRQFMDVYVLKTICHYAVIMKVWGNNTYILRVENWNLVDMLLKSL